jgi:hypothetical protein
VVEAVAQDTIGLLVTVAQVVEAVALAITLEAEILVVQLD